MSSSPTPGQLVTQMGDARLSVAKRIDSVRQIIAMQADTLYQALPRHLTQDRFTRIVLNCVRKTPKLLDCVPESFFGAVGKAAALGLELDGMLGHGYLIPFGKECTLVAGYKGLIDLCRRSGTISTIQMEVVHEGDHFQYQLGDDPFIRHMPNDDDPGRDKKPITHAYVVVGLRDGGKQRKVWSAAKINAHKEQYSRAWNKSDSPWQTNWAVMAKKTVVRDMVNRGEIPASAEIRQLAMQEEIIEATSSPVAPYPQLPYDLEAGTEDLDKRAANLKDKPPRKPRKKPEPDSQVDPAVDATDAVDAPAAEGSSSEQGKLEADYLDKVDSATGEKALVALQEALETSPLRPNPKRRVDVAIEERLARMRAS